jgi:CRISPR/Cas system-associated exonuclease Cas4 (RecB family)
MNRPARPHWSFSSVSQYIRCPLQFYFERVRKLPRTSVSDAQVLGSALHSALAEYHRKLQGGEPVLSHQIQDVYLSSWDSQAAESQVVAAENKTLEDSRDLGIALVEIYLKEPPPQNIVAVEQPMLAPIANSQGDYLETPILIVADVITRQIDGTLQVGEIKTSGRAYSESEVATSLQPTFYANSLYELTGEEPAVEYAILVKTKTPKIQRIEAIRTTSDYQRLGDLIGAVEAGVNAGIFYPVESPINCSGCPFYRPCRDWTGHSVQVQNSPIHSQEFVLC